MPAGMTIQGETLIFLFFLHLLVLFIVIVYQLFSRVVVVLDVVSVLLCWM